MIWRHRGIQLTPEHYHGIPPGWRSEDILAQHQSLRGSFALDAFEIGAWAAPCWMTQRYDWLRYRETLRRVCEGVRAGDAACIEIAVRYIVLRYIGSYSGFLRTRLARSLKAARLTTEQMKLLNAHFLALVQQRDYTEEWRDYHKLWRQIIDGRTAALLRLHFADATIAGRYPKRAAKRDGWLPALLSAAEHRARL